MFPHLFGGLPPPPCIPLPPLPCIPLPPPPCIPLPPLPCIPLPPLPPFICPLKVICSPPSCPAPEPQCTDPIPNMPQPAIMPAAPTPCASEQNVVSPDNCPPEENAPAVQWISTTPQNAHTLCAKAVVGGNDSHDGSPLWVIRAKFEGDLIPGKLVIKRCAAYVPWNGKENSVNNIEVCCARPEKIRWVESSGNSVPENAVVAGYTARGEPLYVGRAKEQGSVIPGKVCCARPERTRWVDSSGDSVPENAAVAGYTSRGEPLYVGRAKEQGSVIPGKVHLSQNAIYFTFNGVEIAHRVYQVLCVL